MPFVKTWTATTQTAITAPANTATLSATIWIGLINAMRTAGWTMDGSSNGGKATVNSVGAGTNFVISNVSGNTWQLTDNSGNNLFTADMVGSNFVLATFTNGGNNGTFVITAFTNNHVLQYTNASAVAETGPGGATWSVQAAAGLDGVDRLSSGVANFVWAAGGSGHWWFVMHAPASTNANSGTGGAPHGTFSLPNRRFLFAGSTAATTTGQSQYNATSATAAFTAGSTTADPTNPTNHITMSASKNLVTTSSTANHHYQSITSTVGDFIFFASRDGTGYAAACIGFVSATQQNETQGDQDAIELFGFQDSGHGGAANGVLAPAVGSGSVGIYWSNGSALTSVAGMVQPCFATTVALNTGNAAAGGNGQSNVSGAKLDFPILLGSSQDTTHTAWKGVLTDIAWAPQNNGDQGMTDPATIGVVNSIKVGDIYWPAPNLTADWTF